MKVTNSYHSKYIFASIFCVAFNLCYAQIDSTKASIKISGYVEIFYQADFANPLNHTRPNFVYAFNRHNEFNLNIGFLKANYETEKLRANFALMNGTYANANLANEPGVLKNILEANAGIKISKIKNVWVDAGVFALHLGFESAIGKDCANLTRSILADNSPYFETGAKINYTSDNNKWYVSGLVLNGWQRIQRIDGNNTPAFGHQITYKPNIKVIVNSSSFIGNDKSDSVRQMRYFHNFYAHYQATNKMRITVGFDIGAEQVAKGSSNYNSWYSPIFIIKYEVSPKYSVAARLEYYKDKKGVIIAKTTPNGFQTLGYSINYDYTINNNAMWRMEAKSYKAKDKIFNSGNKTIHTNFSLTTSLSISF